MLFAVLAHKLLVIKEVLTTQKVIPHVEVTLLQFVIPYHYQIFVGNIIPIVIY